MHTAASSDGHFSALMRHWSVPEATSGAGTTTSISGSWVDQISAKRTRSQLESNCMLTPLSQSYGTPSPLSQTYGTPSPLSQSYSMPSALSQSYSTLPPPQSQVLDFKIRAEQLPGVQALVKFAYTQNLQGLEVAHIPHVLRLAHRFSMPACVAAALALLHAVAPAQLTLQDVTRLQAEDMPHEVKSHATVQAACAQTLARLDAQSILDDDALRAAFCALPHSAVQLWGRADHILTASDAALAALLDKWADAQPPAEKPTYGALMGRLLVAGKELEGASATMTPLHRPLTDDEIEIARTLASFDWVATLQGDGGGDGADMSRHSWSSGRTTWPH